MGPGVVGTAGSAGPAVQVGLCTLGRARATQMVAVGNPKREGHGAQRARVVHVALPVRWAECTRVGENGRVAQQAAEEVGRQTRARVDHEEAKRWARDPGRGEGNAAGPVGACSQDKAHGGRTLVGCGAADGVADGVVSENGGLGVHRGEKVDDEDDVVVVGVVVVGDYEGTVVAAPVAGLVAAAAAVVVVVAAACA
jgi:hypothetical protein